MWYLPYRLHRTQKPKFSTCLCGDAVAGRAEAALTERGHREVVSLSTVQPRKPTCGVRGVAALHFLSGPPDGARHVQFDVRRLLPGQLGRTRAAREVDSHPLWRTGAWREEFWSVGGKDVKQQQPGNTSFTGTPPNSRVVRLTCVGAVTLHCALPAVRLRL